MAKVELNEAHLGYTELHELSKMLKNIPATLVFDGDLTIYDETGNKNVVGVHYDENIGYYYIVAKNGQKGD